MNPKTERKIMDTLHRAQEYGDQHLAWLCEQALEGDKEAERECIARLEELRGW